MSGEARWFIIHTYSGYENKVAENIGKIVENRKMHDKILGVNIPLEKVVEVKNDKTVEVERKIFPGYVVVKLAVEYSDKEGEENVLKVPDETWHAIRYTRGVTGFVGPGSKPVPLTEEEMVSMGLCKDEVEVAFGVGDTVVVTSGVWENTTGIIKEVNNLKQCVTINIDMFGRETPVEIGFVDIKKI